MKEAGGPQQKSRRSSLAELLGSGSSALRRKLIAIGLVVMLALAGSVSAVAWRQYEGGKRRALRDLEARAVLAATVFDVYFSGQLATLRSIAASPSVVSTNKPVMHSYFLRIESAKPQPFTGGLGWIDSRGFSRVSSSRRSVKHLNVSDRPYFREVMKGGKPYVSGGLRARLTKQRVIVMAVPTRDLAGRTTGVLAGALTLRESRTNKRSIDLGYEGLAVIDRAGQELTQASFPRPANTAILATLRRGEGVLTNTRGLDGSSGRVVAYANSRAPSWTTVIDRSQAAVFAAPQRALEVELVSIGAATLILLGLLSWAIVRTGRASREARADAERWDELTQSLGEAVLPAEVSNVLVATLERSFQGCSIAVSLTELGPGSALSQHRGAGLRDEELMLAVTETASRGEIVVLPDREAVLQVLGELGFDSIPARMGTLMAAPLHTPDGERRGSVMIVSDAEGMFDGRAEALLTTHVEGAGRALARTSRYEHEHEVAVTLQESLLPPSLPDVEGMRFAARYAAGGAGLAVGGDWYDVLHRPDGIVHLTVGDVAGRGIEAAATMARVRHAFRAYAYEYASPAQIVHRLRRHVLTGSMATVVCVAFDPYSGRLAYASAGHPPPLLLDGDGAQVGELDVVTATPLGWKASEPPIDTHLPLSPGAILVAYTDGLVESRGDTIEAGISRAASALERSAAFGVTRIVRALLAEAAAGSEDDVAVLVSLFVGHPSRMSIEIPARTEVLAGLRRRLESWLDARGLERDERADAVLAISEACNNAIEHAYADDSGTIELTAAHGEDRLLVKVRDHGAWREQKRNVSRGRGMLIMRGVMDTVDVDLGSAGTSVVMELELGRDRGAQVDRKAARGPSPVA